ncbi:hypothetical protein [uncultured Cohaesibacter sp.]
MTKNLLARPDTITCSLRGIFILERITSVKAFRYGFWIEQGLEQTDG